MSTVSTVPFNVSVHADTLLARFLGNTPVSEVSRVQLGSVLGQAGVNSLNQLSPSAWKLVEAVLKRDGFDTGSLSAVEVHDAAEIRIVARNPVVPGAQSTPRPVQTAPAPAPGLRMLTLVACVVAMLAVILGTLFNSR
jgi:hypothetical protein